MSGGLLSLEGWGHHTTDCRGADYHYYHGTAPTDQHNLCLDDARSAQTCDFLLKEEAKERSNACQ